MADCSSSRAPRARARDALQVRVTSGSGVATAAATVGDATLSVAVMGVSTAPRARWIGPVIDTTGSMQDEIAYLQTEVADTAARIVGDFPNVTQRWALILYRTRMNVRRPSFDFTLAVDLPVAVAAQTADGGDDYPEAPEQASPSHDADIQSECRPPDGVLDCGCAHHDVAGADEFADILAAQRLGIHLYPIAASGSNDLVEYTMRTAAEATGGRYLFLTSDSGIGGAHQEPTIPCYYVTTLNRAMPHGGEELTGGRSRWPLATCCGPRAIPWPAGARWVAARPNAL